MLRWVPLLGFLGACAPPQSCPSLSAQAVRLDIEVVRLNGFVEDPFVAGAGEVIQTQAVWDMAVARWETAGGLAPDFETEQVFVHRWVFDGCTGDVAYAAWIDGDRLRVVIDENEPTTVCRAFVPTIDLILVSRGAETDVAWCAAD